VYVFFIIILGRLEYLSGNKGSVNIHT